MHREILLAILPYLGVITVSVVVLGLLVRLSGASLRLRHVRGLHGDQEGGVQSLSFVLTLPLFVMIMMFIVQLTQITIGKVVVEYAAFSTARSAVVWIPANLGVGEEEENQIGDLQYVQEITDENGKSYSVYEVRSNSAKFKRIHFAAAMACMPICPSRDVGSSVEYPVNVAGRTMAKAYASLAPSSVANPKISARLNNKLAFALENTHVNIRIHHKEDEPQLQTRYDIGPYPQDFTANEIGWQDQIVVTVKHDFALLPGPGRLLARRADARPGESPEQSFGRGYYEQDSVARRIKKSRSTYVYPMTATVRLSNEGEKPLLSFVQRSGGWFASNFYPYRERGRSQDGGPVITREERAYDRDEEYYWRRETINPATGETRTEEESGRNVLENGRPK